jgi:hypothetical protein
VKKGREESTQLSQLNRATLSHCSAECHTKSIVPNVIHNRQIPLNSTLFFNLTPSVIFRAGVRYVGRTVLPLRLSEVYKVNA